MMRFDEKQGDDVRDMLRSKAAEVRVSDDAWAKIAARLDDKPAARTLGRRLALAGAAAAAVAGTVVAANLGTETQVADPPPPPASSIASDPSLLDPVVVATEWLRARVPGAELAAGTLQDGGDGNASVLFLEGPVQTEVVVRQLSGREGWGVVGASSDMIPLFDVSYDGVNLQGRANAEAAGDVTIDYLLDGEVVDGGHHSTEAGDVMLGWQTDEPVEVAAVRVTLTVDGVTYLSEQTAQAVVDPATPVGSYVAIHPATDSAGLAELQRQADTGFRSDLLDPQAVAGAFLAELLPRGETPTSYTVGEFQLGDGMSGEVPYTLSDGSAGVILLRNLGEADSIWFVSGVTSEAVELGEPRREETHLVVDVTSQRAGTLAWTGAPSVEVGAGQVVSIGRPDTPIGSYPVVVRLLDGDRTLAIAARLG